MNYEQTLTFWCERNDDDEFVASLREFRREKHAEQPILAGTLEYAARRIEALTSALDTARIAADAVRRRTDA